VSEAEIVDVVQVPRGEWEALKAAVAELQRAVRPSSASGQLVDDGRTDRRGLLKHGGLLVAGALAGGTALVTSQASPAAATTGTMQFGAVNDAGSDSTELKATSSGTTLFVVNSGFGGSLHARDGETTPTGTGSAIVAEVVNSKNASPTVSALNAGTGDGVVSTMLNGSGSALHGICDFDSYAGTFGGGSAVKGEVVTTYNAAPAMVASTAGTGDALDARVTNGASAGVAVFATTVGSGPAVWAQQLSGSTAPAILGDSSLSGGPGVQGITSGSGAAGVIASSGFGPGVDATTADASGAAAVQGATTGTGPALRGTITNSANTNHAVFGATNGKGAGVYGQITNAASTIPAVTGVTNGIGGAVGGVATGAGPALAGLVLGGTGPAISAGILNPANTQPGLNASTNGTGAAIQGVATGNGIGLNASSTNGRGAILAGGAAQAQLVPSGAATHPSAGQAGDLFVDKTARLWFCTVTGSPATWKQVQVA
jgi:hypothetical protein